MDDDVLDLNDLARAGGVPGNATTDESWVHSSICYAVHPTDKNGATMTRLEDVVWPALAPGGLSSITRSEGIDTGE